MELIFVFLTGYILLWNSLKWLSINVLQKCSPINNYYRSIINNYIIAIAVNVSRKGLSLRHAYIIYILYMYICKVVISMLHKDFYSFKYLTLYEICCDLQPLSGLSSQSTTTRFLWFPMGTFKSLFLKILLLFCHYLITQSV